MVMPSESPTLSAELAETVTESLAPSKLRAEPTLPGAKAGLPCAEVAAPPAMSSTLFSNGHQPTRPEGALMQLVPGTTVNTALELSMEPAALDTCTDKFPAAL